MLIAAKSQFLNPSLTASYCVSGDRIKRENRSRGILKEVQQSERQTRGCHEYLRETYCDKEL